MTIHLGSHHDMEEDWTSSLFLSTYGLRFSNHAVNNHLEELISRFSVLM